MTTRLNPEPLASIHIGTSVSSVADWLRSLTVQITGPGYSRGSGVIWRADGLIITNAHVANRRTYRVDFNDGHRVQAQVIARDPGVDLAALQVDLRNLAFAPVRSALGVRTGELVIAVGNPWDGEGAVSTGIVHRPVGRSPCILADIKLAPGNSGGPLGDAHGNVIGINSAIIGGLGCGISSDTVQEFLRRAGMREAA